MVGRLAIVGIGLGRVRAAAVDPARGHPTALAAGDFDGDGRADALVFDRVGGAAALLPGDGHGSFGAAVSVALAKIPAMVVARDMNLDGTLDLVAGYQQSAEIDVFMGDGHGAFLAPVVSHASEAFQNMSVDDVDGDGIPDLVAGFGYQGAGVLLGNGDASLSQVSQCAFQSVAVTRIRLADLDGNGLPEIVASHDHAAGSVQVLANVGGGHFRNPKMWGSIATDGAIEVADFDGNGRADVAVVNSDDKLIWFKGAGKTGAPAASGVEPFAMMLELHAIDLDGDGHPDLLGFDSPAGASIHLAFGSGAFQFQPVQSFLAGPQLSGCFVADLDGDGLDEIVLASSATQSLTILQPPRGRASPRPPTGRARTPAWGARRSAPPPRRKLGMGASASRSRARRRRRRGPPRDRHSRFRRLRSQ